MKTSGKLLWILVGFLALVILISAVLARSSFLKAAEAVKGGTNLNEADKTRMEKEFGITDFTSVELRGMWSGVIQQGDAYAVSVNAPAYVMNKITAEKRGDALILEMSRFVIGGFSDGEIRVSITCPALESFRAEGAASIQIENFESPKLDLRIDGAGSLKGIGNRIGKLTVNANGAASVDLKESLAKNASIEMDGAASVVLTMNGGTLDGEINGLGSVEYFGEVLSESIRKNGLASVKRR